MLPFRWNQCAVFHKAFLRIFCETLWNMVNIVKHVLLLKHSVRVWNTWNMWNTEIKRDTFCEIKGEIWDILCETICEIFTWNILCYFLSFILRNISWNILWYSAVYYFKKYFVLYFCEYFTLFTYFTPGPNVSIIAHISQYCTLYFTALVWMGGRRVAPAGRREH